MVNSQGDCVPPQEILPLKSVKSVPNYEWHPLSPSEVCSINYMTLPIADMTLQNLN